MYRFFTISLIFIFPILIFDNTIYNVRIGKLPDCNGFNFCNVEKYISNQKKENEVLAYINVTDEKRIEFSFIKKSISDKLFLKYFSTGYFLLDEDFIFSSEICEILKITRCKLKQGKYEILDNYDKYVVVFACY